MPSLPTVYHGSPPLNPLAGDLHLNAQSGQVLMHDGIQWVAVDPSEPRPSWTLTEQNGLWILRIHPKKADEIDAFIKDNKIRGYRVEREVIFSDFEDAVLIRLKFQ